MTDRLWYTPSPWSHREWFFLDIKDLGNNMPPAINGKVCDFDRCFSLGELIRDFARFNFDLFSEYIGKDNSDNGIKDGMLEACEGCIPLERLYPILWIFAHLDSGTDVWEEASSQIEKICEITETCKSDFQRPLAQQYFARKCADEKINITPVEFVDPQASKLIALAESIAHDVGPFTTPHCMYRKTKMPIVERDTHANLEKEIVSLLQSYLLSGDADQALKNLNESISDIRQIFEKALMSGEIYAKPEKEKLVGVFRRMNEFKDRGGFEKEKIFFAEETEALSELEREDVIASSNLLNTFPIQTPAELMAAMIWGTIPSNKDLAVCPECEKPFIKYGANARKFCSEECFVEHRKKYGRVSLKACEQPLQKKKSGKKNIKVTTSYFDALIHVLNTLGPEYRQDETIDPGVFNDWCRALNCVKAQWHLDVYAVNEPASEDNEKTASRMAIACIYENKRIQPPIPVIWQGRLCNLQLQWDETFFFNKLDGLLKYILDAPKNLSASAADTYAEELGLHFTPLKVLASGSKGNAKVALEKLLQIESPVEITDSKNYVGVKRCLRTPVRSINNHAEAGPC